MDPRVAALQAANDALNRILTDQTPITDPTDREKVRELSRSIVAASSRIRYGGAMSDGVLRCASCGADVISAAMAGAMPPTVSVLCPACSGATVGAAQ